MIFAYNIGSGTPTSFIILYERDANCYGLSSLVDKIAMKPIASCFQFLQISVRMKPSYASIMFIIFHF
jgi:hypothetical protein